FYLSTSSHQPTLCPYTTLFRSMIQDGESESTWANFFKYLNKRGLYGTKLVISDSHTGLVFFICQSFTGVLWQRCRENFMRNVLTDRKSTRLNSSHVSISYAVFC